MTMERITRKQDIMERPSACQLHAPIPQFEMKLNFDSFTAYAFPCHKATMASLPPLDLCRRAHESASLPPAALTASDREGNRGASALAIRLIRVLVLAGLTLGRMAALFLWVSLSDFDPSQVRSSERVKQTFGVESCQPLGVPRLGFSCAYAMTRFDVRAFRSTQGFNSDDCGFL
jgi:hypothetical protein